MNNSTTPEFMFGDLVTIKGEPFYEGTTGNVLEYSNDYAGDAILHYLVRLSWGREVWFKASLIKKT